MNHWFFFKCFLIGISAASAVGPIFILTFNNSALRGIVKGISTAIGGALADGFLLFLGLVGALSFFENSKKYQVTIDLIGGFLLLVFGLYMIFQPKTDATKTSSSAESLFLSAFKAFSLTVLNPLTILFFIFVSTQLLQSIDTDLSSTYILLGSSTTALGSFSVFGSVAYIASRIGKAINHRRLKLISIITGAIIVCIGIYFGLDAIRFIWH
jgi:L-lysine exporter family protein LysE/ArgO